MIKQLTGILFILLSTLAYANVDNYFESIKNNPAALYPFLYAMPKGADLHNHLGGAGMAENMLKYVNKDHLCLDERSYKVSAILPCPEKDLLNHSIHNPLIYNQLINAWSMRDFSPLAIDFIFYPFTESGHDHFFAVFDKYYVIQAMHSTDILAEIMDRAGKQNELYLEIMVTLDFNASGMLGKKVAWNPNLDLMRHVLIEKNIAAIAKTISKNLDVMERKTSKTLMCHTKKEQPGCHVKVRYLYQVLREQPPEQIFAQLLAGFIAANQDPRIVGINIVQPEDGYLAVRDYKLHMKMIGYLHQLYPKVPISLHAGELSPQLVLPQELRFHIQDAIYIGHAERIGHGVSIAYEDHYQDLLKYMAEKKILVEINLISNAKILNVQGSEHPLPLYLVNHVPVALSTDDEGVLRTNLTEQYVTAVLNYHFSYAILKNLVRNSITYSFLPGKSVWQNDDYKQFVSECKRDKPSAEKLSSSCEMFLRQNEKAAMQWKLEQQFLEFELNK